MPSLYTQAESSRRGSDRGGVLGGETGCPCRLSGAPRGSLFLLFCCGSNGAHAAEDRESYFGKLRRLPIRVKWIAAERGGGGGVPNKLSYREICSIRGRRGGLSTCRGSSWRNSCGVRAGARRVGRRRREPPACTACCRRCPCAVLERLVAVAKRRNSW